MNAKHEKIAALCASFLGQPYDARYLAWFDCFNQQRYFEAHEVLEDLWLPLRREPAGDFYKGLIQLAGAFVHLQHGRVGPAEALFSLADRHLARFPDGHEGFPTSQVCAHIRGWAGDLAGSPADAIRRLRESPPKIAPPSETFHAEAA